jgi:DNA-binding beta-propeller fold protein YncE
LNSPQGVSVDKAGNVYIADTDNHRIRKVTTDGRIVTIAGDGTPGYAGDGGPSERARLNTPTALEIDPASGDLFIADMRNHCIRRISAGVITTLAGDGKQGYSGDGGPASNTRLDLPTDLALATDRGLLILEPFIHRIRRVDLASGIITGIAADAKGNVYVTDLESKRVRVIRSER